MSIGYGVGGGIGIGKETTPGTPVAASLWLPMGSESVVANRNVGEDGTIYGDRSIKNRNYGMINSSGGWEMPVDGSTLGLPLALWNGNASGAYARAAVSTGFVTAAPTATPTTGAGLADGVYRYAIESVWKTPSGARYRMPASAQQTATAGSGDNIIGLGWDAPGASPIDGFEHDGYVVLRSEVDGDNTTLKAVAYIAEGVTTFNDDGAKAQVAGAPPVAGSIHRHLMKKAFSPGTNPLPPFTTTVVKDNDKAEQFSLCRMNEFNLNLSEGNNPVQASFTLLGARKPVLIDNPTITHTVLSKFMGWQTEIGINGEYDPINEGFQLQCSNGAALVPGCRNRNDYRDVGYGQRSITGTLSRGFENHDFWSRMVNGCRFDLRAFMAGAPITEACYGLIDGVELYPFSYCMLVDVYECTVNQAGASVGGPDRLVEQVQFGAQTKPSAGTDMQIALFNLTGSDYV